MYDLALVDIEKKQVQSFPSVTTILELDWGGKGNDGQELYTWYSQETSSFVLKCECWLSRLILWNSLLTRTVLFDYFQTIKLDLCLCCKVNTHCRVILVNHSTKCQFWYVEIVNKTSWSTSLYQSNLTVMSPLANLPFFNTIFLPSASPFYVTIFS